MEEQQGERQRDTAELEDLARVKEEEAERLRKQVVVAKGQLQLQNTINNDKIRLLERKYEEVRRLNHILLALNPAASASVPEYAPLQSTASPLAATTAAAEDPG